MNETNENNDQATNSCTAGYKLLGDFWVLRIIGSLSRGEKRFSQLERELGDCNTATLSKRLSKLHEDRMIVRNELSRADVTYSLTEKGKLVLPVLKAMDEFAEKYEQN